MPRPVKTPGRLRRSALAPFLLAAASAGFAAAPADDYPPHPDSVVQPGVPKGKLIGPLEFHSKIIANTVRRYWVYVPAKYDPKTPPNLLVFQDGQRAINTYGKLNIPVVLDNLIAKSEIPQTLGIFITPGSFAGGKAGEKPRSNRSFEYDSLGDAYARFLLDELLPEVEAKWKITKDPAGRCTVGISSGGICAFTAAWEKPEQFGLVLSHIGSFTNIRGGHVYPALIRKTERKPLRVFLQDGSNDLNNLHGNWPLANQEMASALAFAGCDFSAV